MRRAATRLRGPLSLRHGRRHPVGHRSPLVWGRVLLQGQVVYSPSGFAGVDRRHPGLRSRTARPTPGDPDIAQDANGWTQTSDPPFGGRGP